MQFSLGGFWFSNGTVIVFQWNCLIRQALVQFAEVVSSTMCRSVSGYCCRGTMLLLETFQSRPQKFKLLTFDRKECLLGEKNEIQTFGQEWFTCV